MKRRPREEDAKIEQTITFLVEKINEHNTNPKPLILHSLRVGLRLYEKDERTDIVIAGLLHDLLEDTKCTKEDLIELVGKEQAEFIDVFNYDDPDVHYKERWTTAIQRMVELGRDAAIVKLVDIKDNLRYLTAVKDGKEVKEGLFWRHKLVLDSFRELLADDEDYIEYEQELEKVRAELHLE